MYYVLALHVLYLVKFIYHFFLESKILEIKQRLELPVVEECTKLLTSNLLHKNVLDTARLLTTLRKSAKAAPW